MARACLRRCKYLSRSSFYEERLLLSHRYDFIFGWFLAGSVLHKRYTSAKVDSCVTSFLVMRRGDELMNLFDDTIETSWLDEMLDDAGASQSTSTKQHAE